MSEGFAVRVEQGLKLSRRIYYGKGITLPLVQDPPSSPENFLPTAITAYASITDPVAVDNPDVPIYQPYVHARCDPSALVPLQMLGVEMKVDCWLDTAFDTVTGRWRVHCVMPSKRFDCCVAVPMGEKGSFLSAETDVLSNEKSYKTKRVTEEETSDLFCLYLSPGTTKHKQLFKRRVVFLIDISGSMKWKLLEDVKKALLESLAKLEAEDVFNIIAFNDDILEFSTSMEFATYETISAVTEWLDSNLIATGGTNLLLPLKQAMKLLEGSKIGVPLVYLVTDGSVGNEREICNAMKESCSKNEKLISPRISTFGIGSFCNHYFLQTLARIGNGYYDGTNNTDSFELQMTRLFDTATSTIEANTTFDALKLLRSVELFPSEIRHYARSSIDLVWKI